MDVAVAELFGVLFVLGTMIQCMMRLEDASLHLDPICFGYVLRVSVHFEHRVQVFLHGLVIGAVPFERVVRRGRAVDVLDLLLVMAANAAERIHGFIAAAR